MSGPRKEPECIAHIAKCLKRNSKNYKKMYKISQDFQAHYVPEIGRYVRSDAYIFEDANSRLYPKIIFLEFEEHQKNYSILNDPNMCPHITVPSRKLHYYRPYNAQYWIKIDSDGTPICIPYWYVYKNRSNIKDIGAQGRFVRRGEKEMIIVAARDKEGNWPDYLIIGWRSIFAEFRRILKSYDNAKPVNLLRK